MAQSVERILGKDEVISSILISSSRKSGHFVRAFLLLTVAILFGSCYNKDVRSGKMQYRPEKTGMKRDPFLKNSDCGKEYDMFYYLLLAVSVVMFGISFFFGGKFTARNGGSVITGAFYSLGMNIAGFLSLLIINVVLNGVRISISPFTLLLASCSAISSLLFTICQVRALDRVNLSVFSMFSMIGGMALPFVFGIAFYNEGMTLGKGICFVLIAFALFLSAGKISTAEGWIYNLGIFVFNGMSGVLSMLFEHGKSPLEQAVDYSICSSFLRIFVSLGVLLFLRFMLKEPIRPLITVRNGVNQFLAGSINTVANYFLVIALTVVPGSLQYPLITGGVITVTTLLGYLTQKKPSVRDLIAVGIAVVGMCALLID